MPAPDLRSKVVEGSLESACVIRTFEGPGLGLIAQCVPVHTTGFVMEVNMTSRRKGPAPRPSGAGPDARGFPGIGRLGRLDHGDPAVLEQLARARERRDRMNQRRTAPPPEVRPRSQAVSVLKPRPRAMRPIVAWVLPLKGIYSIDEWITRMIRENQLRPITLASGKTLLCGLPYPQQVQIAAKVAVKMIRRALGVS